MVFITQILTENLNLQNIAGINVMENRNYLKLS
jgi:hypothetical protein